MKKRQGGIIISILFTALLVPTLVFAQGDFGSTGTTGGSFGTGQATGSFSGTGTGGSFGTGGTGQATTTTGTTGGATVTTPLQNPIRVDTIPEFVEAALGIVLIVGVPIVAFFLILSGFMFVVARGNAEKLETAKRTLLYTIIGAALLLGAWVIAQLIQSTVDALRTP